MENIHYQSLKEEIAPLAIGPTWWSQFVLVRVRTEDLTGTLRFVREQWQSFAPDYPFEHSFMDERFAQIYGAEERLARVFGVFSSLAVLLACLGLFGLATYMAEQRTKEIGIRKVLGASVTSVVLLLSKGFVRLVLVSFIFAAPIAYLLMRRWLEDFAYRIELGAGVFLLAGAVALMIALSTVIYRSVKAALADPVDSLRYE